MEKIMEEMGRRLKILDDIAAILEKYSGSSDSDQVLDEIRSIMSTYLKPRSHAKSLSLEEMTRKREARSREKRR